MLVMNPRTAVGSMISGRPAASPCPRRSSTSPSWRAPVLRCHSASANMARAGAATAGSLCADLGSGAPFAASFHAPVNGHRLGVRGGTVENRMSGLPRARGIACVQEFGGRPVVPHQQVSRRSDGSSSGRGSRRWPRGRPQDRGAAPAGVDRTVTPVGAEPMSSGSCFPSPVRGVEVHGTRVTSLREKGL